jgi:2'-5' RNA ligase
MEPIDWSISDFCLVESVTDDSGASYQILRRWPLVGQ